MISSPSPSRLHSLDAWPGECARPALRLLEPRTAARRAPLRAPARAGAQGAAVDGWLRRLRAALGIV